MWESKPKKVFISAPYNCDDMQIIQDRLKQIANFTGSMVEGGRQIPILPISVGQFMLDRGDTVKDTTFQFWSQLCATYIDAADHFHVLCLDGWEKSVGVAEEIRYWVQERAQEYSRTIIFVNPENYCQTEELCDCMCHLPENGHSVMHCIPCCSFCHESVQTEDGLPDLDKISKKLKTRWGKLDE